MTLAPSSIPLPAVKLSHWTTDHVGAIGSQPDCSIALIGEADFCPATQSLGIWDAWPVQNDDGSVHDFGGGASVWMALAAPWFDDPEERHSHARIHLFLHKDGEWQSLGAAMPDGFSPGSREWSGSAIMGADGKGLTLYFTAAGARNEASVSFNQRLFQAQAAVTMVEGRPRLTDWHDLRQSFAIDHNHYMDPQSGKGQIGTIKAFRDPGFFRDPATGRAYLFFTGSLAASSSAFNGAIGAAVATDASLQTWDILPPVVSADMLNNELERPHVIVHDGHYYLFWSTQAHVFNPEGAVGPTGLYGMVSRDLLTGWKPLNGTGLVAANPPPAPRQAYSWLVLPDLRVISFVDDWGRGADADGTRRFGGSFAPEFRLRLAGDAATLER